ncbi:FAD-dependent oxidoreductase [Chloroflexota bacterium]
MRNTKSDLVIIGGGGAGLAAAVAAAENGCTGVTVLEKRTAIGGNTIMSAGLFAVDSPAQKRAAIEFRRDEAFNIAMEWAHWKTNPRLVRAYINKSGDTIKWLENKGLFFECVPMYPNQPLLVWHWNKEYGAGMMKVLQEECNRLGVKILTRTAATKLLVGEGGNISGVLAEKEGEKFSIAADSVIIATGGYGGNKQLLKKHSPVYRENMKCDGIPHTGDGIIMATEIGAANEGLGFLLMSGPQVPNAVLLSIDYEPEPKQVQLMGIALEPNTLWVNKRGERFVDEATSYHHYVCSNAVNRQPDNISYTLFDHKIMQTMTDEGLIIGLGRYRIDERIGMPGLERELKFQTKGFMCVETVDDESCNGCGICVENCPAQAIELKTTGAKNKKSGGKAVIQYVEDCRLCKSCELSCPQAAISFAPLKKIEPHVKISSSWNTIAKWMGCEPAVLKASVDEYNNACDHGYDHLFNKRREFMLPLREPPFYAIKGNSDFLDTIGGIKINERMEVLDTDDYPIPSLYAAGVTTGGWQSDTYNDYLPGAASGFAIISGRIAGENAAALLHKPTRRGKSG